MESFADFVEGPLLWFAWGVFILGCLFRLVSFFSMACKKDKVIFSQFSPKYVFLTWIRYLLPFNQTVAKSPIFSILGYVFHFCLLFVPIFIIEHVMYWEEESVFEWVWWAMPDNWAYWMTLAVIAIGVIFMLRRIFNPDVRILTSWTDYLVLVVTILPFLTGWLSVNVMDSAFLTAIDIRLIHILSGELMLILIPLTKLSHFVLFFPSRWIIGVEWGRRGYSA